MKARRGKDADLASKNCEGRTGHKTAHGRGRNELYDPTESQKANSKDGETLWGRVGSLI